MILMKNNLLSALCVLLTGVLLLSCEKPVIDDTVPSETTAMGKVTIRVADVEAGWSASTTRALVNVSEVCTRLCFAVYKDGSRVKSKNQAKGDSDFGTFSMELESGDYQILVLAHSGKSNPTTTHPDKIEFTNPDRSGGTGFTDTFYYYGDLTVTAGSTQVDISMKRATSMFRVVTTDVKPANIKKFQFYYEGGSRNLDATTGFGYGNSQQSVFVTTGDELTGQTLQFDMFTFLHAETGKVTFTVKAFDDKEDIIYQREFKDVSMQRNCITRYTGKYFVADSPDKPDEPEPDPEEPKSMVVMVDPEWANIFDFTF